MNLKNNLWTEKFRPDTLDGYIGNKNLIRLAKQYIETGDVPHLLFYGVPGTGKTTLSKIIGNSIDCDVLYINASDENSVDVVRDKIKSFASQMGFKESKIVILDEADRISPQAQAALRNLMETFSVSCRFILTCNHVSRIHEAVRSRCLEFQIHPPNKRDVAIRLISILKEENVEYTNLELKYIINSAYPDIRKVIAVAQSSVCSEPGSVRKKLMLEKSERIRISYVDDLLAELINTKDPKILYKNLCQILADSKVRDFAILYRFLFDNLESYASGKIADVTVLIAEYQQWDSFAIDKVVHIAAMFVKIIRVIRS